MLKQILTRPKFEGVVEAVHYTPEGYVKWVRAYERRGPTWSDHILIDRQTLIERIKNGERFFSGERKEYLASEFEIGQPIRVLQTEGGEVLVTGETQEAMKDTLAGVPII